MARWAGIAVPSIIAVLLVTGSAIAQKTTPVNIERSQTLQVELTSTVQARKAKVGDVVKARTVTALILAGQNVIPEGTKITGHVSRVDHSPNPGPAAISVSFDQFHLKHGRTLPAKFGVQAAVFSPSAGPQPAPEGGGNRTVEPAWLPNSKPSRNANTVNTSVRPQHQSGQQQQNSSDEPANQGDLRALSAGTLIGMPGVTLKVDEESGAATFSSVSRKLELPSGLQFVLRIEPTGEDSQKN